MKLEMRYTPRPWTVQAVDLEGYSHVFAADPNGSASDGDLITIADLIENDANARLIAAAPDLLEAARVTLAVLEVADDANDTQVWIRERTILSTAIQKAVGAN